MGGWQAKTRSRSTFARREKIGKHVSTMSRVWACGATDRTSHNLGKSRRIQERKRDEGEYTIRLTYPGLQMMYRFEKEEVSGALLPLWAYQNQQFTGLSREMDTMRRASCPTPECTFKPLLTEEHHVARLLYGISKLDVASGLYDGFYQSVHVDEK
jgi:hypothetical protein